MLLKNENASIRLDFVSYEFPETEYGMDEYDKNWLQLRCTWVDEDGYTHKDSNACLLAQELAGMNAGLKVLAAGIKDRYDSDFISSDLSLFAWAEGELFRWAYIRGFDELRFTHPIALSAGQCMVHLRLTNARVGMEQIVFYTALGGGLARVDRLWRTFAGKEERSQSFDAAAAALMAAG